MGTDPQIDKTDRTARKIPSMRRFEVICVTPAKRETKRQRETVTYLLLRKDEAKEKHNLRRKNIDELTDPK